MLEDGMREIENVVNKIQNAFERKREDDKSKKKNKEEDDSEDDDDDEEEAEEIIIISGTGESLDMKDIEVLV